MIQAIILMGVSGSGKTSIGKALSSATSIPFYDGDDFMPAKQIEKMANGKPLTDDDREPWLESLHLLIADQLQQGNSLIVASSALKRQYRTILRGNLKGVEFVYLKGNFDLIHGRMAKRKGHYMKADMLRSQFDTLQEPNHATIINIEQSISECVKEIIQKLGLIALSGVDPLNSK